MTIRILITGNCGYIGAALTRMLSMSPEFSVFGYDKKNGFDILDYFRLLECMEKCKPDIVIHLADTSDPNTCLTVNVIGTYNVLQAMKEYGCHAIIYASSGEVYGNQTAPICENMPKNPHTKFACSKLLGEYVVWNHFFRNNHGSYLIYRIFTVGGLSGFPNVDNLQFLDRENPVQSLLKGSLVIHGTHHATSDGTREIDIISLTDVCDAFLKGIINIGCRPNLHHTFNICSGIPVSIKQLLNTWNSIAIQLTYNKDVRRIPFVQSDYKKRRITDISHYYGSNTQANEILGWQPYQELEDIIFNMASQMQLPLY